MLRKLRVVAAAATFTLITLYFLDFAGWHPEQRAVRQRREHGRQQADPDAEFIGCDQRKEVDRQQDQSPLRNQMA